MIRKAIIVVLTLATVASVGVWGASYGALPHATVGSMEVWIGHEKRQFDLEDRATLWIRVTRGRCFVHRQGASPYVRMQTMLRRGGMHSWSWLGGRFEVYWTAGTKRLGVAFPAWFPCVLFGAYPSIALVRGPLRRWRRHRKGLCLKCSYDLTGNVTGVCSEGGRRI